MKSRRIKGLRGLVLSGGTLAASLLASPLEIDAAPIQWTLAEGGNDHYYELIDHGGFIDWTDARDAAEAAGGYLATITSSAENDFLTDLSFSCFAGEFDEVRPCYRESWIGFTDEVVEGEFRWHFTDEAVSFTNWATGEPNNDPAFDGEDYAILNPPPEPEGTWNDLPNDPNRVEYYLVEYDEEPTPTPEPGTWLTFAAGMAALVHLRRRRR